MSTEFYMSLREKAAQIYTDEKERDEYIDGFITKVAITVKDIMLHQSEKGSIVNGMAQAAGKALVGGIAGAGFAGLMGAVNTVKNHNLYNLYLRALNEAKQSNSVLRGADTAKVINFGNTIFKFAPHVAPDSNMLSSILANAVHGDGIDPMTIRTLTELEGRYRDSRGESNFNPKSWI